MTAWLALLGIDGLEQPGWLFALGPLALVVLLLAARRRLPSLPWPALTEARSAGAGRLDLGRACGLALRAAALLALAAVLAGPVALHRMPPLPGQGLDLVLAVDASGSMRALDTEVGGRARTRLDLARQVVARFASRRASEGDRVGLVVFGESTFTQCPLTSDGRLLAASLERVRAGVAGEATALGDALALAVKRASAAPGSPAGRVVVLLTDGRSNAGALAPDVAAEIAAAEGVRVHTVAIGSEGGEVPMAQASGPEGPGLRFERHDVDVATARRVAAVTGGRFYRARRASDLEAVYAEIDALERVTRPLPPRVRRGPRAEPLLALAGGLLLLEIGWLRVGRRRLP